MASTTQTFSLDLTFVVGLEDPVFKGLEAYPNPFSDKLTVRTSAEVGPISTIEICDLLGREVAKMSGNQLEVDLATDQLTPGLYVLEVVSKEGQVLRQRVVKR